MEVEVVWGTATGRTELGATDGALAAAGIQDYNLVELSSVVPAGGTVVERGTHERDSPRGTAVGVVLARAVAGDEENPIAGLGWHLADEGGVFYEATAGSRTACRESLRDGLADAREIRNWNWTANPSVRLHTGEPAGTSAVVVAAVFGPLAESWT
jgi:arginine decarboxylase